LKEKREHIPSPELEKLVPKNIEKGVFLKQRGVLKGPKKIRYPCRDSGWGGVNFQLEKKKKKIF